MSSIIKGYICFSIGIFLMFFSLFSFIIYLSLFFISFILSIIAITQKRIFGGVSLLLLTIIIPILLGVELGVTRTTGFMGEVLKQKKENKYTTKKNIRKLKQVISPNTFLKEKEDKVISDVNKQYIKNVFLYDLKAKYYDSVLKGNIPGVEFKLKNKGNKILTKIKVTIYFKDFQNNIISEASFQPLLTSNLFLSGNNKPLKPNYIWKLEKDKFYPADTVPSEWQEGNVSAKISEIKIKEIPIKSKNNKYIEKISLYNLKAKYYDSVLKGNIPGVEFKLKNKGNKILTKIKVTIYFKDSQNNVIFEENFLPILTSNFSLSGNNKPLKPNYIWNLKRDKFYSIDTVPSEWQEGNISAEISEIKIKKIPAKSKKDKYIEKISLYDLKAKYHDSILFGNIPGVEFKLKNKGNKILTEVKVIVYFKDSNNIIIAEDSYYPVLTSKMSFSHNNQPLKPNYIWKMEEGKFYSADTVPIEWKEGNVSAEIIDIKSR